MKGRADMEDKGEKTAGGTPGIRPPASRFFRNVGCEYFPCHEAPAEEFNCLFCYCPLYHGECPGEPRFARTKGAGTKDAGVKDCSACLYPHDAGHYEEIVMLLVSRLSGGRGKRDDSQG